MTKKPQARATQRRTALLNAAVDLLTENGFAALTHRAVAHRAALPLAATTYYFASRDDLLAEAFTHLVERELHHLRRHGLAGLADDLAATDRLHQLGLWELYVHAGRDPALQAIARRWSDGCLAVTADHLALPPAHPRARLLYATVCALWLEHVVEQRPLDDLRTLLALAVENASRPE
ncbi:TetR/AcrR family transcriptional regulator [Nonomuraea endophytica]|uniref:DNA-binding transcriptional regulator YbjK n=1 Tax=Nonomuraea endophytica TaxID=714136 RepID=A0A7W8A8R5_9ACTN|nr:TetR family transcriptional regulator [Nonomuraea endophytica]MBB5081645.1 DNA-binding transcriptional regulator YbjK [Nonomuraea endophytica]